MTTTGFYGVKPPNVGQTKFGLTHFSYRTVAGQQRLGAEKSTGCAYTGWAVSRLTKMHLNLKYFCPTTYGPACIIFTILLVNKNFTKRHKHTECATSVMRITSKLYSRSVHARCSMSAWTAATGASAVLQTADVGRRSSEHAVFYRGVDRRMGSKWTLGRVVGMVWSGFTWLRIRTGGGLLWTRWWTFRFWRHGVSLLRKKLQDVKSGDLAGQVMGPARPIHRHGKCWLRDARTIKVHGGCVQSCGTMFWHVFGPVCLISF
jgi:hypothetical protein